ncbi:hypothetical protein FRC06_007721, partial [Ceratobasidium sp. 370]
MNGAYTEAETEKQERPTQPKAGGGASKPQEKLGVSDTNSQQYNCTWDAELPDKPLQKALAPLLTI